MIETKTTKEIINDNMDRGSLPATPQFYIYMESPHYNPNTEWVLVSDEILFLEELDIICFGEHSIAECNVRERIKRRLYEFSQSNPSLSGKRIGDMTGSDKLSNPDGEHKKPTAHSGRDTSNEEGLPFDQSLDNDRRDTLIHYRNFGLNRLNACGKVGCRGNETDMWSLVSCPDCLKHKKVKS